jgi:hypothetical protein
MRRASCRRMLCVCCVMGGVLMGAAGYGQQLPDAPSAAMVEDRGSSSLVGGEQATGGSGAGQTSQGQADGVQTKRILGIIPNFRSVSADAKLPPLTVKQKFVEATQDSFDYSAIFLPAVVAGYSDAEKSTPEFGHGGIAYARYLWHSAADQTIENYTVEFIGPALTREDPRYYTKGRGGFLKRTGYSLSRAVITRTDNDTETFNYSEILGAGAAAGISDLYYPSAERTAGKTLDKFATNVGIDAATFMFKEFWPDINRALFHGKQ